MHMPVRVVVVDGARHVRANLEKVIEATPGFELVGIAMSSDEAVGLVVMTRPDLVLIEVENSSVSGLEATRRIFDLSPSSRIIALTESDDASAITEVIAAGASGYLLRSAPPDELVEQLRWAAQGQAVLSRNLTAAVLTELTRLYQAAEQRAEELHASYLSTVDALAAALGTKDDVSGNHSRRVCDYATILARAIDPSLLEREAVIFGFMLHDVGKIGVPESILLKPGPLSEEERAIMRKHPEMGSGILESVEFLRPDATDVVIAHHECWDGSGYPRGLKGNEIPLGARIFAVTDCFDAMTTDRPYRRALSVLEALEEIQKYADSQFDPDVVQAFFGVRDEIVARMEIDVVPQERSLLQY